MRVAWLSLLLAPGTLVLTTAACHAPDRATGAAPEASTGERVARPPLEASPPTPRRPPEPPGAGRSGSAVARGASDDFLYVADEDHATLRLLALPIAPGAASDAGAARDAGDAGSPPLAHKAIPMPGRPANVLVQGDRVLVTIRDPSLLLVLRPDADVGLVEVARVALPPDAWGIAAAPDGRTALVTSAWAHRVSAVDLASLQVRWSVDVPREPRGVVVRTDGRGAYVSHLTSGAITRLDGLDAPRSGEAPDAQAAAPRVTSVPLPVAPLRRAGEPLEASLGYALVLSADGARLFAPRHALGAAASQAWFGVTTVDVLLTATDSPLVPARGAVLARAEDYVSNALVDRDAEPPLALAPIASFTQPRDAAIRPGAGTLLVAGEGDAVLAELDARAIDPALQVVASYPVGCRAPAGFALSADGALAYVFCRATCELSVLRLTDPRTRGVPERHVLAADPLPEPAATGRRLFYDATDPGISGGLACAACHPDGRDDGHVWHEIETSDATIELGSGVEPRVFVGGVGVAGAKGYARQTPMLAGRVRAEGPYGWHAENPDLPSRLFEGVHLHRWLAGAYAPNEMGSIADALVAFLRAGLVPPPKDARPLTPEEDRGKQLFESREVGCAMCHLPGSDYTDRTPHELKPWPARPGFDPDDTPFKPPSLLFVGGSAPYFHDGSAATLEDLVRDNGKRMGSTAQLAPEDRAALVAFLRTL